MGKRIEVREVVGKESGREGEREKLIYNLIYLISCS